ncbi:DUF1513 domain-containing protein [Vibrio mangrovi]|uniref:DUF1513 domain-containing protein n=1 Tax=Vibrio mangrovi TaxID=474394 RepID=A0A1Y6INU4_9VIBR|nr:DUF1513 domain-containing protein [Vibrio mangrovi]MDW6003871.1 DUF1513 domain-containing protein [Vibrio mangrovi]SMR99335.1 hypothetical protein VIM7927_00560 [Vibrio mangrovi]
MQPMVTDQTRRKLLRAALFSAVVPVLPYGCALTRRTVARPALVGCAVTESNRYQAVVADSQGNALHTLPLPARGHGVAIHPAASQAVAFGRRPGMFMLVFDYMSGAPVKVVTAMSQRHFYGHGVYSLDGDYLYVTEGDRKTSQGIIGVYDVRHDYQKVAEFSGFGLGPHEVIIKPDGTLAIGVGGVHTYGRTALNADTMRPSLTYMSSQGKILEQVTLGDHHLSIRHLAHDGADTVLCGQQYRGTPDDYPALITMHRPGEEMITLKAEPESWARFNHYVASIAATDKWILATSPPGNCYGIWSKETLELVELAALPDASGVVVQNGVFQISSGAAKVVHERYPAPAETSVVNVQWDNHWSAI